MYRISGDNVASTYEEFQLSAILNEWEENTITYNNLPTYFPHRDIARTFAKGDNTWFELDIITDTIQEYIKDPARNFGFMFETYTEGKNVLVYSSEESSNPTLRPKLTITYDNNPVGINNKTIVLYKDIKLKKASGSYLIYLPFNTKQMVSMYDISGRKVSSFYTNGSKGWQTIPGFIPSGMHIIRISTPEGIIIKKFNFLQ